jgi:pimeloyl-ACP methyl ester carboxylesterase
MESTPKTWISGHIIAPDGAALAYHCLGTGAPLVIVHGAGAANAMAWTGVTPKLAQRFTVYAMDRQGHGQSGDGPDYALEREFEDLAALVQAIGEPVNVLGHSLGGLCALEAGLLTPLIKQLVLYEPLSLPLPGMPGYPGYPAGFFERLEAQIAAGDREGTLMAFYQEIVGLLPQEIEALKASPTYPARLAAAHTLPRELKADVAYTFEPSRFRALKVPTLLLEGGDSRDFEKAGNAAVAAALPDCRVTVLPGQQHIAMYTAPELFLQAVLGFLLPLVQAS